MANLFPPRAGGASISFENAISTTSILTACEVNHRLFFGNAGKPCLAAAHGPVYLAWLDSQACAGVPYWRRSRWHGRGPESPRPGCLSCSDCGGRTFPNGAFIGNALCGFTLHRTGDSCHLLRLSLSPFEQMNSRPTSSVLHVLQRRFTLRNVGLHFLLGPGDTNGCRCSISSGFRNARPLNRPNLYRLRAAQLTQPLPPALVCLNRRS